MSSTVAVSRLEWGDGDGIEGAMIVLERVKA
jgi:hypothetical protein